MPCPVEPPTFVVAAVCLRDAAGRILTVRKKGTAAFMLPGGKIEPGETPAEAGAREVAEEVGLVLGPLAPLGRFVADAANEPGHLVDSTVFTAEPTGEPVAAAEIAELRWVDPDDETSWPPLAPLLRDHVLVALAEADRAS